MAPTDDRVRMQIPVSPSLAGQISDLADIMRRSQRWMATELLKAVVDDRKSLEDYLAARIVAFLRVATDLLIGTYDGQEPNNVKVIHLDVMLDAKTAKFIEGLAQRLGHTPAKMAAQMLVWGVDENDFAIRLVAAPLAAAQRGLETLTEKIRGRQRKPAA